jgi:hypothetical protein
MIGAAKAIEVNATAASTQWTCASTVILRPGWTVMKPAIRIREAAKIHSQIKPRVRTSPL